MAAKIAPPAGRACGPAGRAVPLPRCHQPLRGVRVVEGARLESVYGSQAHRGFESHPLSADARECSPHRPPAVGVLCFSVLLTGLYAPARPVICARPVFAPVVPWGLRWGLGAATCGPNPGQSPGYPLGYTPPKAAVTPAPLRHRQLPKAAGAGAVGRPGLPARKGAATAPGAGCHCIGPGQTPTHPKARPGGARAPCYLPLLLIHFFDAPFYPVAPTPLPGLPKAPTGLDGPRRASTVPPKAPKGDCRWAGPRW